MSDQTICDLGNRLQSLRLAHHPPLSRAEVGRRASITAEALRQIEVGIIRDPGVRKMQAIAKVFGLSLGQFLGEMPSEDIYS